MPRSPALQAIVDQLRREPSRTWSIVITLFGDAILPRGGSVWLGTLLAFFREIGTGEGAVRTAMSRLTADGWLLRTRIGRNSFYRLGPRGEITFGQASRHIYAAEPPAWDGEVQLVLAEGGPGPELAEAGFGPLLPGLWIRFDGTRPPGAAEASPVQLTARPDLATARELVGRAWPLERMAASYRRFVDAFAPLRAELISREQLSEEDAIVGRILMVHAYRRIILRDPILPRELLPEDWPGRAARDLASDLYVALLDRSENWLDHHGVNETGPLPDALPELRQRFRDRKRYRNR